MFGRINLLHIIKIPLPTELGKKKSHGDKERTQSLTSLPFFYGNYLFFLGHEQNFSFPCA